MTSVFGTSKYLEEGDAYPVKGEFYDFAPIVAITPCPCLFTCCVPEAQKKRTFMNADATKLVMNTAMAPCFCLCDDEKYMIDNVKTMYYDKPPFRSGMCCHCIPCTCCGPPVIFSFKPKILGIDTSDYYGSQIKIAPSNIFNLKLCICCLNPCYTLCSTPAAVGVKNPDVFLAKLAKEVNAYHEKHGILESERVIFASISDDVGDFGGSSKVVPSGSPLDGEVMTR